MIGQKKKKAGLVLFLLISFLLVSVYFFLNKSHRNPDDEKALQVSPSDLYRSLYIRKSDEYLDKVVEVKGLVRESKDSTFVIVVPDNQDAAILVNLNSAQINELDKNVTGKEIKVKGICTGLIADTLMEDLIIVNIRLRDSRIMD